MKDNLTRRSILKGAATSAAFVTAAPYFFTRAHAGEDPKLIRLYMQDGSLGDLYLEHWYKPFVEKHDLKAEYIQLQGGNAPMEKLQAQIAAGRPEADVLPLHANQLVFALRNDMLMPVPRDAVPEYANLYPQYVTDWGPGMVLWCYGLAYNTEKVTPAPTSWKTLWGPEYAGRVALNEALKDQALEMVNITFKGTPYPVDEETFKHLTDLRPNLVTLWSSGADAEQLFRNDEIVMTPFWNGRVTQLKKEGLPIAFAVPDEGFIVRHSTYAVPKNARNPEMAMAWLDFVLGVEPQKRLVEYGYGTPNKLVTYTPEEREAVIVTEPDVVAKAITEDFDRIVDESARWDDMWTAWKAS
ncbi:MAG: ABC transporter substrate-binding protein [Verrucomicrobia bacterium]|nr:ABC transporter substrate-binding protein [Verrucomicrobiota bacterium]